MSRCDLDFFIFFYLCEEIVRWVLQYLYWNAVPSQQFQEYIQDNFFMQIYVKMVFCSNLSSLLWNQLTVAVTFTAFPKLYNWFPYTG